MLKKKKPKLLVYKQPKFLKYKKQKQNLSFFLNNKFFNNQNLFFFKKITKFLHLFYINKKYKKNILFILPDKYKSNNFLKFISKIGQKYIFINQISPGYLTNAKIVHNVRDLPNLIILISFDKTRDIANFLLKEIYILNIPVITNILNKEQTTYPILNNLDENTIYFYYYFFYKIFSKCIKKSKLNNIYFK